MAINAVYKSAIPEMPYERVYGERVLCSVANFTRQDAQEFLALAATVPVHTEVEVLELEQANEALARVRRSEVLQVG